MLDCVITGGTVVDGTGRPGRRADVGIRDGLLVAVGTVDEPARRTIDAEGLVVAPGFVDIHTHYDAQLFWDPYATPSCLHGVTTVIGGNCGFTIAPLAPETADYVMRMLARVEGMPLESLAGGLAWDWTSFADWLDRLDGTLGVNAGFLAGHSTIRRAVMGEAAVGTKASDDDVAQMARLLHDAMDAGALGFSSSLAPTHNDGDGSPVPSRAATDDELVSLAGTVRDHAGTTLEFIPGIGAFTEREMELMTAMSLAGRRPLNWNVLVVDSSRPEHYRGQLAAGDHATARGARVIALTVPDLMKIRLSFASGMVLDAVPGWAETFALPMEARKKALDDPAERRRLRELTEAPGAAALSRLLRWERMTVNDVGDPTLGQLVGRTIGDIAAERGREPFDAMLDVVVADDLRTGLIPPAPGDDDESWRLRAEVWRDPRAVIGASDAGAHLDMSYTFSYFTALLGESVRERGVVGLEDAVHFVTDQPARLYGLRERGRLAEGWHADVTVFDPDRVGRDPARMRHDLPGGAGRLFQEARGVEHVLVNGVEIVARGELTSDRPGTLLRSGRDTETVAIPAAS